MYEISEGLVSNSLTIAAGAIDSGYAALKDLCVEFVSEHDIVRITESPGFKRLSQSLQEELLKSQTEKVSLQTDS